MAYLATIGFFDGVHLGHLSLIQQLLTRAHHLNMQAMLITFSSHPRQVTQGTSPQLLLTHDQRLKRLMQAGVNRVLEMDFSTVQSLTAEQFMDYLHQEYQVDAVLMGYDHRFGCDQLKRIKDYKEAGSHVGVQVYRAQQASQGTISSTKIRRALQEGRIEDANRFLGYPYTLEGEVVHGQHIGTSLGFPTANLQPATCNLIPKSGVYAAMVNGKKALVNIGNNPTFGANHPLSIEVHIPDFAGDLYGKTLSVQLLSFLREDQSFPSQEALIAQIHKDIDHLAQLLLS